MIFDLQKANVWKRISSFIFDAIITSILMVGFAFLISKIVRYDDYNNQLNEYYAEYEELYGVSFTLTSDEFAQLSDEDLVIFQEAYDAFNADEEAMEAYDIVINLTMIITVLAIFLAIFGLEFVIPLILKNGQTMGKKIFGLGVVKNNGVRINSIALFVRSVLGKCVLETMIPVFIALLIYFANLGIIGTGLIVIFLLIQITLFIVTRYHTLIHDFLSYTTVVDIDSQLIFESEETMLAYKNKLHSEKVSKSN
ncbi:MAG: RDD family protein [Bacilli bacterium]